MLYTILHRSYYLLRRLRQAVLLDATDILLLASFLSVNLYPSQALALVNDIELSHQRLIFIRDETLRDQAIVGIEAFPENAQVAGDVLVQKSFVVRSPLPVGTMVRVLATAYSSTAGQTDASPFITAAGTQVHPGTLAANFLPFGTKVKIGGITYTVLDRMNSRYNDKYIVDIWKPTVQAARQHGVQVVTMEIIEIPQ